MWVLRGVAPEILPSPKAIFHGQTLSFWRVYPTLGEIFDFPTSCKHEPRQEDNLDEKNSPVTVANEGLGWDSGGKKCNVILVITEKLAGVWNPWITFIPF